MNINIQQSTGITEQVANNVIGKIYDISKNNAITSNFIGNLTVDATYQDYIDTLQAKYPELYITARKLYIKFEDPEVERILKEKGCSSDGIGITMEDASTFIFGQDAFKGNTTITSFNEFKYFTKMNNTKTSNSLFQNCTNLTSIDLTQFSINIPIYQFYETGLISLDAPLVPSICSDNRESQAFFNCPNLTTINLPSCTFIGEESFKNCPNLTTVNIPNVTKIGYTAFEGCSNLVNLQIDWSKITQFSSGVFYNCTSLGENQSIELTLSQPESSPSYVFQNTKFKSLVIHGNVGSWGNRNWHIHYRMNELTYLDYSDSNLNKQDVCYCSKLVTIVLPSTITEITFEVTNSLAALQHFIILVEDPDDITYGSIDYAWRRYGTNNAGPDAIIYVKDADTVNRYKAHTYWSSVPNLNENNRIRPLSELPVGVWKTGLYQQYEPYLSHSDDPAYA